MCVMESAVGGPLDQYGAPLLQAFQTQRPATVGTFTWGVRIETYGAENG